MAIETPNAIAALADVNFPKNVSDYTVAAAGCSATYVSVGQWRIDSQPGGPNLAGPEVAVLASCNSYQYTPDPVLASVTYGKDIKGRAVYVHTFDNNGKLTDGIPWTVACFALPVGATTGTIPPAPKPPTPKP